MLFDLRVQIVGGLALCNGGRGARACKPVRFENSVFFPRGKYAVYIRHRVSLARGKLCRLKQHFVGKIPFPPVFKTAFVPRDKLSRKSARGKQLFQQLFVGILLFYIFVNAFVRNNSVVIQRFNQRIHIRKRISAVHKAVSGQIFYAVEGIPHIAPYVDVIFNVGGVIGHINAKAFRRFNGKRNNRIFGLAIAFNFLYVKSAVFVKLFKHGVKL